MITDAERGVTPRSSATVGDLLDAWFEQAARDFPPTTVKETRGYIDRSLLPGLGKRPLAKLSPAEIDAFYGRWIGVNPAASASPPKVPPSKIAPPDPAQLAQLLARARDDSPELACYVLVAAATGARRSELVALRWSGVDVDLANATLNISRGIVIGPNGMVEKDTKTHSSRRVSLDAQTAGVLTEHRAEMASRAAACGVALSGDSFVFSNTPDCSVPWFPASVSLEQSDRAAADVIGSVISGPTSH